MQNIWSQFQKVLTLISGAILGVVMLMVVADVIGRILFNHPIIGTEEIITSVIPIFVFLPMAYAEILNDHIRVEILMSILGKKWETILDVLASVLGIGFLGMLTWASWEVAIDSFNAGEYYPGILEVRVWPSRFAICFGSAFFAVQLLLNGRKGIKKIFQDSGQRLKNISGLF